MQEELTVKGQELLSSWISSEKIHKQELAETIGVSHTYIYALMDANLPFTTRKKTLARLAFVMTCPIEKIAEYHTSVREYSKEDRIIEKPRRSNYHFAVAYMKYNHRDTIPNNWRFIKTIPIEDRLAVIDTILGFQPLPINPEDIVKLCKYINIPTSTSKTLYKDRLLEVLEENGFSNNWTDREFTKPIIDSINAGVDKVIEERMLELPLSLQEETYLNILHQYKR